MLAQPIFCQQAIRERAKRQAKSARALAQSCHPLLAGPWSRGYVSSKEYKNPVASVVFSCAPHTNFGLHASRSVKYIQAWLCMYSCISLIRTGGQQSDGKTLQGPAWMPCWCFSQVCTEKYVILLAVLQAVVKLCDAFEVNTNSSLVPCHRKERRQGRHPMLRYSEHANCPSQQFKFGAEMHLAQSCLPRPS